MSFVIGGTTGAIVGGALIGGAATLGGAAISANAAGDAADKQTAAAREANSLQERMFNQQRADQEPWRQAGIGALSQLGNADFQRDFTAQDFQKDPGYDFRMREGQKALERSAAARGGLQSGGTLKALSRYGQDYASNEYQNAYNRFNADRDRRFNRLYSLAGIGQTASSQIGAYGQAFANNVGSNTMGAAKSAGEAGLASASAWGGALSGIGNTAMQGAWMNRWAQQQQSNPLAGTRMAGESYANLGGLA